eukprot:scaffold117983_cov48-Phaeocystis_antarctica.AAC.1
MGDREDSVEARHVLGAAGIGRGHVPGSGLGLGSGSGTGLGLGLGLGRGETPSSGDDAGALGGVWGDN